jgi:S-DNA-T family DNA segregation ATPase FtsK/SpoIIIE
MFRKLKVAYQEVYSFLFGQEKEHIHTREQQTKFYGRIIKDNDEKTKMIHQYPRQAKFRFPVINDEKTRDKASSKNFQKNSTTKPTRVKKEHQESKRPSLQNARSIEKQPAKERKKFQGVNFKAENIPSPIFAFSKPTYRKKVEFIEEQLAEIELITELNEENLPSFTGIAELELNNSPLLDESLLGVETEILLKAESEVGREEEINGMNFTEIAATTEQAVVEEAVDSEEEAIIENVHEEVDAVREESQPVLNQETKEVQSESVAADLLDTKDTKQLEPLSASVNIIKSEPKVTEQEVPEKNKIPFNVLMFHKDRVANKKNQDKKLKKYQFPTIQLLNIPPKQEGNSQLWLDEKREILERTLMNFNVQAKVVGVTKGPSVTRFEILPDPGVKVSKVTGLIDDIKLSLAAKDIRIEAPIPGKNAIGIEVPNDVSEPVFIREILRSGEFQNNPSPLTVAMGLDIEGKPIVTDIQKMPHGLIAGATGSGKSVCINSILISIIFKATPDEVKLMLIDPKMVELAPYNDIPHLVTPVITDAKQATIALKWAVEEMERRYELFVQNRVRDIKRYNEVMKKVDDPTPALPFIVIVIDELADLMMVSPHDVEEAICRIAQKARACGIHLLVATQRPSVDVITGLIKANIPTRIAFSVSSQVDSRTIIDSGGAEKLLGKGDMLLFENGSSKSIRVQGNFVSDEEIDRVIALVKEQQKPNYLFDKEQLVKTYEAIDEEDDLFEEACYYVLEQGGASSSSLQRKFRIGFNRAARLIDMMEVKGIISKAMGSKPRNILVSEEELSGQISN